MLNEKKLFADCKRKIWEFTRKIENLWCILLVILQLWLVYWSRYKIDPFMFPWYQVWNLNQGFSKFIRSSCYKNKKWRERICRFRIPLDSDNFLIRPRQRLSMAQIFWTCYFKFLKIFNFPCEFSNFPLAFSKGFSRKKNHVIKITS